MTLVADIETWRGRVRTAADRAEGEIAAALERHGKATDAAAGDLEALRDKMRAAGDEVDAACEAARIELTAAEAALERVRQSRRHLATLEAGLGLPSAPTAGWSERCEDDGGDDGGDDGYRELAKKLAPPRPVNGAAMAETTREKSR